MHQIVFRINLHLTLILISPNSHMRFIVIYY